MKLNSARQAWHDCYYSAWDSQGAFIENLGLLGAMVQTTQKQRKASHAMHQALAGCVQQAIGTLPQSLRAFGSWMYNPIENDDERELAEELVFVTAYNAGPKMYAKKFEKARMVAAGVLYRYRRMHQGGQGEGVDPCLTPEVFRACLLAIYGLELSSEQWGREWEGFIDTCFAACNDLDKQALVPVAKTLSMMKEAA
ncbi:hypothetical protein [Pseudomonas sp.]|uniref:hypothetical protein n=1 Tax=Pseudomonas sp. TaxID=306 RepID=UPI0028AA326A|nr:hypothetical protein [Pseudomonas sp.]